MTATTRTTPVVVGDAARIVQMLVAEAPPEPECPRCDYVACAACTGYLAARALADAGLLSGGAA